MSEIAPIDPPDPAEYDPPKDDLRGWPEDDGGDVGAAFGCPRCGERRADRLEIEMLNASVLCLSCRIRYHLPLAEGA
jgi:hypothetical protein